MDNIFDRDKALELLRRIFQNCRHIEGKSVKLMPPNSDGVFSKGYQIHIEPNSNESLENCVQKIADNSKLATAREGEKLIIFNPLKDLK